MLNTPRAHLLEQREFFLESTFGSVEDAAAKMQVDSRKQHNASAAPRDGLPTLLRASSLEEVGAQAELLSGGKAAGTECVEVEVALPGASEPEGAAPDKPGRVAIAEHEGGQAAGAECAEEVQVALPGASEPEVAGPEKPGRVAIAEHEGIMCFKIQSCSMATMDAFMQENAAGLVLQGFETIVPSADDPSVSYAYIEPRRFGPHRAQLRITAKVIFAPGQVEIQILDMTLGLADKRTGEIDFEGQAFKLHFKTENTIAWREDGKGGIDVVNRSWSRSETRLPWWFPMPDSVMQRMITFFVRQVVANGQKQTNSKLQAKFHEWV